MTTIGTTAPEHASGVRNHVRYLIVGLIFGGLWLSHGDQPFWEHVARTLLVLVIAPALIAPLLAWWRHRHQDGSAAEGGRLSIVRFVAAKAGLVAVALVADVFLTWLIPGLADLVVAAGLVLAVAVLGPLYHHLLTPSRTREKDGRPGS